MLVLDNVLGCCDAQMEALIRGRHIALGGQCVIITCNAAEQVPDR